MRVRLHVRVYAHRHRRDLLQACRHAVNSLQLWLALGVEGVDPLPQGELDFAFRLAHPREGASARVTSSRDHPLQLATAHDVESAAEPGQQPQHGLIRVGLHGEADQVLHSRQGLVELLETRGQRMLRVEVKGRPKALGERLDGDLFTAKLVADVTEIMHGAGV